jgi:hypothetical protein
VGWTRILVLVALGATLAGFAFSSALRREDGEQAAVATTTAARPQRAVLGWRETHGKPGEQLVFSVESLEVFRNGWRAKVSLENASTSSYEIDVDPIAARDRAFGLMLFATGDLDELEERNADGTLPAIRPATRFTPPLPRVLEPRSSWERMIGAHGSLVAESWVRVVFGDLVLIAPNDDAGVERLTWITDSAYRLRP